MQQHKQHRQARAHEPQARVRELVSGLREAKPRVRTLGVRKQARPKARKHPSLKVQRVVSAGVAAVALSALVALLAALALAGPGSSVYAAPRSGLPTLDVTNIADNAITVTGTAWSSDETITLAYSQSSSCQPSTPLDPSTYTAPLWTGSDFQLTLTWPSTIGQGTYYLCATGSKTGGPITSDHTIIVNANGGVQPTPGSTAPPNATATSKAPATSSTPGHNPTNTPTKAGTTGNGGNGGDSNPGNKGATASTSVSSLVAIILLCLLVLALLVYLIRIWLQGRQAGGPTP